MPTFRENPYGAYNFLVSIAGGDSGGAAAGFTEIRGLDQEIEMLEYRAGNDARLAPRLIPGLQRPITVTLSRGVIGDNSLQEWINTTLAGSAERRTVQIDLLAEDRTTVQQWRLRDAVPVRLTGPVLNATTNAIAVESLVLMAESITVV